MCAKRTDAASLLDRWRLRAQQVPDDSEQRDRQRQAADCLATLRRGVGERYRHLSLSTYTVRYESQQRVFDRLLKFASEIERAAAVDRGLILWGTPGTGKDHLAIALLAVAARVGISARWANTQRWLQALAWAVKDDESSRQQFSHLVGPQVLCLSDPVFQGQSDSNIRSLYQLVSERYERRRPTWATLNAQSLEVAERSIGTQTWSRLIEDALILECRWPDFRQPLEIVSRNGAT